MWLRAGSTFLRLTGLIEGTERQNIEYGKQHLRTRRAGGIRQTSIVIVE